GIDQLLEHPRQTLLCDLEHVEKLGDGKAGPAVDEVQDAVVSAAEAIFAEDLVGIGREVAIGEKEQLDDGEIEPVLARQRRFYRVFVTVLVLRHVVSVVPALEFMSALLT